MRMYYLKLENVPLQDRFQIGKKCTIVVKYMAKNNVVCKIGSFVPKQEAVLQVCPHVDEPIGRNFPISAKPHPPPPFIWNRF